MPTSEELLLVRIEANIKQLEREMRKATQVTDTAARRIKSTFSRVFSGAFIGGFLGSIAGRLDDMALAAVRNADALADQADSLNVNIERLQELQIALRKLGGSEEDAATGLAFFTKELGKAQSGEGKLVDILKSANIPLKDANGVLRSREEVLRDLIHAMSLMTSEEQRFLVATLAFGRNAAQSYNNLGEAGVAAWDKIAKGARENFQVQEEEQVRSLAEMQDELEIAGQVLTNTWSRIIAGWVQFFQDPEKAFKRMLRNMQAAASSAVALVVPKVDARAAGKAAGEAIGKAAEEATPKVRSLTEALEEKAAVERGEDRIGATFADAAKLQTAGYIEQEAALRKLIETKRAAGEVGAAPGVDLVAPAGVTPGVTAPDLTDNTEALKEAAEAERRYVEAIAQRQQIYSDTKLSIEDEVEALQLEARMLGMTAEEADELRARVELLNAAQEAGLAITPELTAEIDALAQQYAVAAEAARDAGDAQRAAAQLAESIGGAFEDAFVNAVMQTETLNDALKNLLKTLAELFLRAALQRALGGFFGPTGGLTNMFGGGRAMGGPVSPGRAYLVGEKGPELFIPKMGGSVMPNAGVQRVAVDVNVTPSPLLVVSWERRAGDAEERAIARGPAVARNNSQRYAIP